MNGERNTEVPAYGEDDEHIYVDRSKVDFDPADGLYSGTVVDGTTEIPGDHDQLGGDTES